MLLQDAVIDGFADAALLNRSADYISMTFLPVEQATSSESSGVTTSFYVISHDFGSFDRAVSIINSTIDVTGPIRLRLSLANIALNITVVQFYLGNKTYIKYPSSTPSATPSSSIALESSSSNNLIVPIVGSVGGAFAVGVLIFSISVWRKRSRSKRRGSPDIHSGTRLSVDQLFRDSSCLDLDCVQAGLHSRTDSRKIFMLVNPDMVGKDSAKPSLPKSSIRELASAIIERDCLENDDPMESHPVYRSSLERSASGHLALDIPPSDSSSKQRTMSSIRDLADHDNMLDSDQPRSSQKLRPELSIRKLSQPMDSGVLSNILIDDDEGEDGIFDGEATLSPDTHLPVFFTLPFDLDEEDVVPEPPARRAKPAVVPMLVDDVLKKSQLPQNRAISTAKLAETEPMESSESERSQISTGYFSNWVADRKKSSARRLAALDRIRQNKGSTESNLPSIVPSANQSMESIIDDDEDSYQEFMRQAQETEGRIFSPGEASAETPEPSVPLNPPPQSRLLPGLTGPAAVPISYDQSSADDSDVSTARTLMTQRTNVTNWIDDRRKSSARKKETLARVRSMPREASSVFADDQTQSLETPRMEPEPEPMIVDKVEIFAVPLPIPRLGRPRVPEMKVRELLETNFDSATSDPDSTTSEHTMMSSDASAESPRCQSKLQNHPSIDSDPPIDTASPSETSGIVWIEQRKQSLALKTQKVQGLRENSAVKKVDWVEDRRQSTVRKKDRLHELRMRSTDSFTEASPQVHPVLDDMDEAMEARTSQSILRQLSIIDDMYSDDDDRAGPEYSRRHSPSDDPEM